MNADQKATYKEVLKGYDKNFINMAEIELAETNDISVAYFKHSKTIYLTYNGVSVWKINRTHWRVGKKGDGVASDGTRYHSLQSAIDKVKGL